MINPTNIATLNVLQNGHLNTLASSSEKGEPYALTLNLARCLDTAVLAGGSECLKSGMTIFKEVLVWWLKKVEHFNYTPHPIENFQKKITSLYKITSHEPNGFLWSGIKARYLSAQQYDLITINRGGVCRA